MRKEGRGEETQEKKSSRVGKEEKTDKEGQWGGDQVSLYCF